MAETGDYWKDAISTTFFAHHIQDLHDKELFEVEERLSGLVKKLKRAHHIYNSNNGTKRRDRQHTINISDVEEVLAALELLAERQSHPLVISRVLTILLQLTRSEDYLDPVEINGKEQQLTVGYSALSNLRDMVLSTPEAAFELERSPEIFFEVLKEVFVRYAKTERRKQDGNRQDGPEGKPDSTGFAVSPIQIFGIVDRSKAIQERKLEPAEELKPHFLALLPLVTDIVLNHECFALKSLKREDLLSTSKEADARGHVCNFFEESLTLIPHLQTLFTTLLDSERGKRSGQHILNLRLVMLIMTRFAHSEAVTRSYLASDNKQGKGVCAQLLDHLPPRDLYSNLFITEKNKHSAALALQELPIGISSLMTNLLAKQHQLSAAHMIQAMAKSSTQAADYFAKSKFFQEYLIDKIFDKALPTKPKTHGRIDGQDYTPGQYGSLLMCLTSILRGSASARVTFVEWYTRNYRGQADIIDQKMNKLFEIVKNFGAKHTQGAAYLAAAALDTISVLLLERELQDWIAQNEGVKAVHVAKSMQDCAQRQMLLTREGHGNTAEEVEGASTTMLLLLRLFERFTLNKEKEKSSEESAQWVRTLSKKLSDDLGKRHSWREILKRILAADKFYGASVELCAADCLTSLPIQDLNAKRGELAENIIKTLIQGSELRAGLGWNHQKSIEIADDEQIPVNYEERLDGIMTRAIFVLFKLILAGQPDDFKRLKLHTKNGVIASLLKANIHETEYEPGLQGLLEFSDKFDLQRATTKLLQLAWQYPQLRKPQENSEVHAVLLAALRASKRSFASLKERYTTFVNARRCVSCGEIIPEISKWALRKLDLSLVVRCQKCAQQPYLERISNHFSYLEQTWAGNSVAAMFAVLEITKVHDPISYSVLHNLSLVLEGAIRPETLQQLRKVMENGGFREWNKAPAGTTLKRMMSMDEADFLPPFNSSLALSSEYRVVSALGDPDRHAKPMQDLKDQHLGTIKGSKGMRRTNYKQVIMATKQDQRTIVLVAKDPKNLEEIVGWCGGGPSRSAEPLVEAEVYGLYVSQLASHGLSRAEVARQRQQIAHALLAQFSHSMWQRGFQYCFAKIHLQEIDLFSTRVSGVPHCLNPPSRLPDLEDQAAPKRQYAYTWKLDSNIWVHDAQHESFLDMGGVETCIRNVTGVEVDSSYTPDYAMAGSVGIVDSMSQFAHKLRLLISRGKRIPTRPVTLQLSQFTLEPQSPLNGEPSDAEKYDDRAAESFVKNLRMKLQDSDEKERLPEALGATKLGAVMGSAKEVFLQVMASPVWQSTMGIEAHLQQMEPKPETRPSNSEVAEPSTLKRNKTDEMGKFVTKEELWMLGSWSLPCLAAFLKCLWVLLTQSTTRIRNIMLIKLTEPHLFHSLRLSMRSCGFGLRQWSEPHDEFSICRKFFTILEQLIDYRTVDRDSSLDVLALYEQISAVLRDVGLIWLRLLEDSGRNTNLQGRCLNPAQESMLASVVRVLACVVQSTDCLQVLHDAPGQWVNFGNDQCSREAVRQLFTRSPVLEQLLRRLLVYHAEMQQAASRERHKDVTTAEVGDASDEEESKGDEKNPGTFRSTQRQPQLSSRHETRIYVTEALAHFFRADVGVKSRFVESFYMDMVKKDSSISPLLMQDVLQRTESIELRHTLAEGMATLSMTVPGEYVIDHAFVRRRSATHDTERPLLFILTNRRYWVSTQTYRAEVDETPGLVAPRAATSLTASGQATAASLAGGTAASALDELDSASMDPDGVSQRRKHSGETLVKEAGLREYSFQDLQCLFLDPQEQVLGLLRNSQPARTRLEKPRIGTELDVFLLPRLGTARRLVDTLSRLARNDLNRQLRISHDFITSQIIRHFLNVKDPLYTFVRVMQPGTRNYVPRVVVWSDEDEGQLVFFCYSLSAWEPRTKPATSAKDIHSHKEYLFNPVPWKLNDIGSVDFSGLSTDNHIYKLTLTSRGPFKRVLRISFYCDLAREIWRERIIATLYHKSGRDKVRTQVIDHSFARERNIQLRQVL
eukprot:g52093.t1